MKKLSGKKTYIAAALTIAGFWGAYLSGEADLALTIQMTTEAALVVFLRLGVAKAEKKE